MAWTLYQVIWRFESPLHSGFAKLGNIQRTRPYVTGRMLWGALTARLTRDQGRNDYRNVGDEINKYLAFSYGYLCLTEDGSQPLLPEFTAKGLQFKLGIQSLAEREAQRLCLTSYASTALDYSNNAAVDGSLHEVEFISPRALCASDKLGIKTGQSLYLTALIAESDKAAANKAMKGWKESLDKLQLGGERNYGFGQLSLIDDKAAKDWWGNEFVGSVESEVRPRVCLDGNRNLLAHVNASQLAHSCIECGSLEPLLGRDTTPQAAFGEEIKAMGIYWQPGTTVKTYDCYQIAEMGLWKK